MCRCPGHHSRRVVAGQLRSGQRVSDFVAQYTPKFVKSRLNAFGISSHRHDVHEVTCEDHLACLAAEEESDAPQGNAPDAEGSESKVKQALAKLHRNLGHPSTSDFTRILRHSTRILRHSRASDKAIELAGKLQCTVCMNHQQPKSALPANVPHSMEFNEHVGLDVKYLRGWKVNHKIPCVHLVDYGTSLQVMVPLPQRETSALLKNALRDKWIAWAGVPKNLTTDPAQHNTGEVFAEYCENSGISLHQTAADAHWQLGKVERHGQWFSRILDRVCDEVRPSSEEEWLDCLI